MRHLHEASALQSAGHAAWCGRPPVPARPAAPRQAPALTTGEPGDGRVVAGRWKPIEASFLALTIGGSSFVRRCVKGQLALDWQALMTTAVLPNARRPGPANGLGRPCARARPAHALGAERPGAAAAADPTLLSTRALCVSAYWLRHLPAGARRRRVPADPIALR